MDDATKRRPLSINERADNLLRYLGAKSDLLGTIVKFYANDNTRDFKTANELLAWTASSQIIEVITLAEHCREESWISHSSIDRPASQNTIHELMLKPPGYSRLAVLEGTNRDSKRAFVAMWFDPSMGEAYDNGIRPAIEDAGYEPIRIDRTEHNNKIDDEIIAEIRRSRFLVADFTEGTTGARGGVYYEAGFAHGLNIPVIFTCRGDMIGNVHFDTRQYNHITWASPSDLRERLAMRIAATLGDGPLKRVE
jgi:hypothetical protein